MTDTPTTDQQQPESTASQDQPAQVSDQPQPGEYRGAGSKDALKADLARERDARQALAAQLDQLKTGLASALGIESEKATPEQLASQLEQARAEAATARAQLAVFTSVPAGVDVQALLDSASFQAALAKADPDKITETVAEFVKANPRFKTPTATPGARDVHADQAVDQSTDINDLLRAAAGR